MKPSFKIYFLILSLFSGSAILSQPLDLKTLNTAVDNNGYWRVAAENGLTRLNPQKSPPPAIFTGSNIQALSVTTEDSPDVLIISGNTSQSENSVFVNPNDPDNPLNSNNSTSQPGGGTTLYGADYLYSFDAGENWSGSMQGAGGSNSGDPTTAIGLNGRYFIGFINNGYGMSVSYSDNQGSTWTPVTVASSPGGSGLDKNHLWIDNSPVSDFEGNLYNSWTAFGGSNNNEIEVSRSTNNGVSWTSPQNVSNPCNAGHHCQGVNVQTGPEGEVYVGFTIYDNWPADENAIGLARSFDGGQTWESFRIISNIKGIRNSGVGKDMRVNSFPVMACDISNGPNRGNLYVTWTNKGVPGQNTGNDIDVYMIRSEDQGTTWSAPIRVNQDPIGQGKKHYSGWITCDAGSGNLSMVFYDDRNVSSSQVEVFCANSNDGGNTWEDFKVSDVAFSPSPIPGLASQYFGDYLGITARNGKVYPVWTDNRTGTALTYTSPYLTSTMVAPIGLIANLNEETGQVTLSWTHSAGPTFDHYNVYRGFQMIGTCTFPLYIDNLPDYGLYRYQVTAVYDIEGESAPAVADVQWGHGQAELNPEAIEVYVTPDEHKSVTMSLANVGELPLEYESKFSLPEGTRENLTYCSGLGNCGEYIAGVEFGNISNYSACGNYEDYTALSTPATIGESFQITVYNGTSTYTEDVCGIWIDWNLNTDFLDDAAVTVSGSPGPGPYTATITVPAGAKNGLARLRIRIKRGGTLNPCGLSINGEVEDYSVNVLGWVTASPMEGTVAPGENQEITFNFNAEDLGIGTYNANYTLSSNDPDNGEILVPVTMHVAEASVTATADKDSLCLGGSTILHASINGGSGTFTYAWTSDPAGFNSSEPDPVVSPASTTTYFIQVTNGNIILNDQITITVTDLPEVNLGADVDVCVSGQAIFDAGAGFDSYLWSNGETGQSIEVDAGGTYWVEVTNQAGCANRDSVVFTIHPSPEISLGPDQQFCEGSAVMLSAGTGFASYLWNTGDVSYYINANQEGEYWVEVTDEFGCTTRDTIFLAAFPLPSVDLGADQNFCEGSPVTLDASGPDLISYLWSTGATTPSITAGSPGEYWVEITHASTCTNRDTIVLTMDPLPVAPQVTGGPSSVDNYLNPSSEFTAAESAHSLTYEWTLDPLAAGTISGTGLTAQVTWSAGYTGNAQVFIRGVNDCGAGGNSPGYAVAVYSSQSIIEKEAISGIKIYPNPNDGTFVLQLNSGFEQEVAFQVTASGGNKILDDKEKIPAGIYRKDFNLATLPGGTYYLVISDSQGRMISRNQIVIQ